MIKTAIFVEGQTELIFVREYLLRYFDFQDIALGCYSLFSDFEFIPVEYEFKPPESGHYFEIINVGMDGNVLTRLLRREKFLWKAGFQHVIGLRDMYSKNYRDVSKVIDPAINLQFITENRRQINELAINPERISFHFAIMETEAWILGLVQQFAQLDHRLTRVFIQSKLGYDLENIDPESSFFHPANELEKIYALVGQTYDKSKGDVNSIMSRVQKEHLAEPYLSSKCGSFTEFTNSLLRAH